MKKLLIIVILLVSVVLISGCTQKESKSDDTKKGINDIPEQAKELLPKQGIVFISAGHVSSGRKLIIDTENKALDFGINSDSGSSPYGKLPVEGKINLIDDNLNEIISLADKIWSSDEDFSNFPDITADFDVILILVDNDKTKVIKSYGPPVREVEKLYDYVWNLVPAYDTVAESGEILVDCVNTSAGYECTYAVPKYDLDTLRLQVNKADDKLREQCEADGGKYKCYGFCTEDYTRLCDFPFEDAGQPCTGDAECQGLCLADDWECETGCTGTCATYRLNTCDNPTHLTNGVPYFESVLCD